MNRALCSVLAGFTLLFCTSPRAAKPYEVPPETKVFLGRVLAVAQHNDLHDIDFTKKAFGSNIVGDTDGKRDMHDASTLDLLGSGPGRQAFTNFTYYYALQPMKSPLGFLKGPDPLFVAELGFDGIDQFRCINGIDISTVFHADKDVGLTKVGSKVFHISQGPNLVTEIAVNGPVEGDQQGCVKGLTIRQHKMTEYVPSGSL